MARSPIQHQGAGSGVVLRHRAAAAACVCLTVDALAAAAYCTPEAQPRLGHHMVLTQQLSKFNGFYKSF